MTGRLKQLIWILPLAIAVLVAGLGWWGNARLRDTIEGGLKAQLTATLNANVTALGIWATNQTRLATSLAEDRTIQTLASQIFHAGPRASRDLQTLPELDQFAHDVKPRLPQLGYEVAQLVNTNFMVVANSTRGPMGYNVLVSDIHTNKFAELFATGRPVIITPFKPELLIQRRASKNAFGQRTNDVHRLNHPPAIKASRVRRGDVTLMQEATNTSSALNLRLHDPGGDLTKGFKSAETEAGLHPLTRLVADAVDGEDEVLVEPTRDYRGVLVVGASRWLPQYGFGVATQIDAGEAFRPLRVLQWLFVALILLLLLCATGLFVFSNLTWHRRLNEAELKVKQLGQYTLEEKIGEGGMGVVYRARHALMRRDTAVKLLLPDRTDPESIALFEREVCLTCQLTHPNTIQVYDYGHTPEGIFYYAMEFLRGLNLHELVARYGPQPEGRVVHILSQICASLAEAHGLGLIHRDIKPGNIFLCQRGGIPDCVKVLDFGLVRNYRAGEVEPMDPANEQVIEGTPWFTPPEAIKAPQQTDPRSDLYSVGALGYYLLTGQYIFDAETIAEIHEKQLAAAPIPPSQRMANPVSSEMEQILMRCLEKEADRRPQSARELWAWLQACPAAAAWTPEAQVAWWDAYNREPVASQADSGEPDFKPMVTVRIDLATRIQD